MRYRVKSKTDVITNSSSVVYIIHPPKDVTPDDIFEDLWKKNQEFLKSGKDYYTGDCQDLEENGSQKIHKKLYYPRFLMDRGFEGLREYIEKTYIIHKIEHLG